MNRRLVSGEAEMKMPLINARPPRKGRALCVSRLNGSEKDYRTAQVYGKGIAITSNCGNGGLK